MSNDLDRRQFVHTAGISATAFALAQLIHGTAAHGSGSGRTREFIDTVKGARLFDLSFVWDENSPVAGVNPSFSMKLNRTHGPFDPTDPDFSDDHTRGTRGMFNDGGQLSFASEVMHWSGQHGAPSIDAIGHIARNGRLFGGVDAAAATSDLRGIGRSGVGAHLAIDHYRTDKLVNRGILLDVARFVNGDADPLDPGFEITARHLERTAAAQGVLLERGDTVLIRTGWGRYFTDDPVRYKGDLSPGPGVDGARFLVRQRAFAVGADTLSFEKRPPITMPPAAFEVFPVHMLLIPDNGIHIIENFFLEELSQKKVYEFLLVVPPIKVRGASGSALRAFALAPDKGD